MPTDPAESVDEVLLALALAIHAMGEAIAALQERQARARSDAERREILMALPLLKTDQRDAESRMAALAASRASFQPPTQSTMSALRSATEALSKETTSLRSASALATAATALLAAVRSAAPAGAPSVAGGSGSTISS